jgi:single-strand DNA-binding protein
MNVTILIGRLIADPTIRYSQTGTAFGSFTLAVDRRKKEGEQQADFISCKVIGKNAEFAEKYLKKGIKIGIRGSIQTGNYTNKDGQKVYTTDVLIDNMEFCEKKSDTVSDNVQSDGFMNVPDGLEDELPFV